MGSTSERVVSSFKLFTIGTKSFFSSINAITYKPNSTIKVIVLLSSLFSFSIFAGVDFTGKIESVWLEDDDKFWFKIDHQGVDEYCSSTWFGFNLYVLKSDPDFAYYYALITSALVQNQSVRVSNVDSLDPDEPCDISATGYGLVVHAQ